MLGWSSRFRIRISFCISFTKRDDIFCSWIVLRAYSTPVWRCFTLDTIPTVGKGWRPHKPKGTLMHANGSLLRLPFQNTPCCSRRSRTRKQYATGTTHSHTTAPFWKTKTELAFKQCTYRNPSRWRQSSRTNLPPSRPSSPLQNDGTTKGMPRDRGLHYYYYWLNECVRIPVTDLAFF